MPFSSGRSLRAPASNATSTVSARVPASAMRWMGSSLAETVVVWMLAIAPPTISARMRRSAARRDGELQNQLHAGVLLGEAAGPRYPPGPCERPTQPPRRRRIARWASCHCPRGLRSPSASAAARIPRRPAKAARARGPRHGRRVPRRLKALRAGRHRPGTRDVRDPPPGDGLPRRADRLGQVDDHAPADQGARADRRARFASPGATSPRSSARRCPYYRRNVGVVFQDFKLLPTRTVYDNIAYALQVTGAPRKQIRATLPDILRLTGLSTKLHNYPHQLSGGEQQRVAVARAFAAIRRCCWPTSPPATSTPRPRSASCSCSTESTARARP